MKLSSQYKYLIILALLLVGMESCSNPENNEEPENTETAPVSIVEEEPEISKNEAEILIPEDYVLFEKISGDLNGDDLNDYIIIVKATKKEDYVEDEDRGALDRNRRGILVYFSKKGGNELITKNLNCFSSENEDGGVYFPPELSVEIKKGKLFILYSHGRYGYWKYTFRYNNFDMDLIGYDSSENFGLIVNRETSVNFLSKRKSIKENTNQNAEESGEEVFKETWEDIKIEKLLKLSEVKDFDSLEAF